MDDLGRAFTYPFKDKDWFSKFAVGAVFMLLSVVLIGFFVLAGYFVRVTQNVMRKEENILPPWDDIGGKLVLGFKLCLVHLIYSLPIILLYIPLLAIIVLGEISGQMDVGGAFTGLYTVGLIVLIIPYALFITIMSPVITYTFAARESIGDALDIGGIFRSFRRNWENTLIVALISIGIHSFAWVGIIGVFIGVFFRIMYAYLVSSYMYGMLYAEQTQEGIAT